MTLTSSSAEKACVGLKILLVMPAWLERRPVDEMH